MEVRRDQAAEDRFYASMAAYMAERERVRAPHTWHVSDLLTPRKTYWRLVDPRPLTRDELGYFLAGRAHHEIIEAVIAGLGGEREARLVLEQDGVTVLGTPDLVLREGSEDVPHEVKTSRKWTIEAEPEDRYLDQLLCYCALHNERRGRVVVFYLTPGRNTKNRKTTKPVVMIWEVTWTDEELAQCRDYLVRVGRALDRALAKRDHRKLPLCESWMCKTSDRKGGYVVQCPYFDLCKPEGRWPVALTPSS